MSETSAIAEGRRLLSSWLGQPKPHFRVEGRDTGADLVVEQDRFRLVVEFKGVGDSAIVGAAIRQVKQNAGHLGRTAMPVVAVPYMGEVGKRLCAEAGVSWFDLSGNANIVAPRLRIIIEGKPNKFVRKGRPSTAFAPKSARVARRLLLEPHIRPFRQQELARETGLDDGFVSRIVRRLEEDGLLDRTKEGAVRVRDPNLLLDAWTEVYDFEKHTILKGHVTSRSGDELLPRVAEALEHAKLRHAATGLAGAWLHTQFAGFRLVTFFVDKIPSESRLRALGFRSEPKGANVWLVVPNDDGVFDGAEKKNGVACVHPVQTYVDLQGQPERAKEAADELRARLLQWTAVGETEIEEA